MHPECLQFLDRCKAMRPDAFRGPRVLDCGSLNMNGSARGHFQAESYTGIDWRPGPGVDHVGLVHEYRGKPDGYFDAVVSTEVFEHDPHWRQSVQRMLSLLRKGGAFITTFASPGRGPHCIECAPVSDYYGGLTLRDFIGSVGTLMDRGGFDGLYCEDDTTAHDVRVFAFGKK